MFRQSMRKTNRSYRLLATPAVAALLFAGIITFRSPDTALGVRAAPPLNLVQEVDRLVFDTPDRMCRADLVTDATIGGLGVSHWTTPGGQRPANLDTNGILKSGYTIVTPVRFRQMHNLVDHRSKPTAEIVTAGGMVGVDQLHVDLPQLAANARYLVVLVPMLDLQTGGYSESRLGVIDAFRIDGRGMVVLRPQTIEQGVISQPEVRVAIGDLAKQLQACR